LNPEPRLIGHVHPRRVGQRKRRLDGGGNI
jgi:hypothetical protein